MQSCQFAKMSNASDQLDAVSARPAAPTHANVQHTVLLLLLQQPTAPVENVVQGISTPSNP